MKIAFSQTPSELRSAAEMLTANVKHGTASHKVLSTIEDEVLSQLKGRGAPESKGTVDKLPTRHTSPAELELDLTAAQWRIFKDALVLKAFAADNMTIDKVGILSETAKTISVGLEAEG